MKRFLLFLTAFIFAVLVIALAAPSFIDWNRYKERIEQRVAEATGLNLRINGDLDLELVPYPKFQIGEVVLQNPEDGGEMPLLTLEEAGIILGIMPLMQGQIVFNSIILDTPRIFFKTAENGENNWITPEIKALITQKETADDKNDPASALPDANSSNAPLDVRVDRFVIANGQFLMRHPGSDGDITIRNINLTVSSQSLFGPYQVKGQVTAMDRKLALNIRTERFSGEFNAITVEAGVELPDHGASLEFLGAVKPGLPLDLQGETGLRLSGINALLKQEGVQPPEFLEAYGKGEVELQGILTVGPDIADYDNLTLRIDKNNVLRGKVGYTGLAPESTEKKLEARFDVTEPLDLGGFLKSDENQTGAGSQKPEQKKGLLQGGFLPETIAVPANLDIDFEITSSEIVAGGEIFKDITLTALKKNTGINSALTVADISGDGSFGLQARAGFGNSVQDTGADTGAAFYEVRNPEINVSVNAALNNTAARIEKFIPDGLQNGPYREYFNTVALSGSADITRDSVSFSFPQITLGAQDFELEGSYKTGDAASVQGPALLDIALKGDVLDISPLITSRDDTSPEVSDDTAQTIKTGSKSIEKILQAYTVPFPLRYSLRLNRLITPSNTAKGINAEGFLTPVSIENLNIGVADVGGIQFSVKGGVGNVKTLAGLDTRITMKTGDIQNLNAFSAQNIVPENVKGPLSALTTIKGNKDQANLNTNIKQGSFEFIADGVVRDLLKTIQISEMDVQMKHPNLDTALTGFVEGYKGHGDLRMPLDLYTKVKFQGERIELQAIKGNIGPTSTTGDITISLGGSKPDISGSLSASRIPADSYVAAFGGEKMKKNSDSRSSVAAREVIWSRKAINTEWMHMADLDFQLGIKQMSYSPWILDDVAAKIRLNNGRLDIENLNGGLFGGNLAVKGFVNSSPNVREPLSFSGNLEMRNVSADPLMKAITGLNRKVLEGSLNYSTDLEATGLSPAALIFDLSGKGQVQGNDVILHGIDLDEISRILSLDDLTSRAQGLFRSSLQGGQTRFSLMSGQYVIEEGIVDIRDFVLSSRNARAVTNGKVNLPRWTIDAKTGFDILKPENAPGFEAQFSGSLSDPGQTFLTGTVEQFIQQQIKNELFNIIDKTIQRRTGSDAPRGEQGESGSGTQQGSGTRQRQPAPVTPEDAIKGIFNTILR